MKNDRLNPEKWQEYISSFKEINEEQIIKKLEINGLEGVRYQSLSGTPSYSLGKLNLPKTRWAYYSQNESQNLKTIDAYGELDSVFVDEDNRLKDLLKNCSYEVIDALYWNEQGASVVQEVAFIIASFDHLQSEGPIIIKVASSSDQFMAMAKLRAIRFLLDFLNTQKASPIAYEILAIPSRREFSFYDPWSNVLRSSTSELGAILGGADYVAPRASEQIYSDITGKEISEQSLRVALNSLFILKEESHLYGGEDYCFGSDSLERLSYDIAFNAWELATNWEEQKGEWNTDELRMIVSATMKARKQKVMTRKQTLVGGNDFVNPAEKLTDLYMGELSEIENIIPKSYQRLLVDFEILRSKFQKNIQSTIPICYSGEYAALVPRLTWMQNILDLVSLAYDLKQVQSASDDKTMHIFLDQDSCYLNYNQRQVILKRGENLFQILTDFYAFLSSQGEEA